MLKIPVSKVLATSPVRSTSLLGHVSLLGHSREGRAIEGFAFDGGRHRISLIGGCHADEPIGPWMLDRLVSFLANLDSSHPLRSDYSWSIVPHTNPDGEQRNREWTNRYRSETVDLTEDSVDLWSYLQSVVRELPGDDLEFGFAPDAEDRSARPENLAIGDFLRSRGPFHLHGSFHGMGFAAGPWFLIERSWAGRTRDLRNELRRSVSAAGYRVHDIDRQGEKGFFRLGRGFTSRPDSRAMAEYFRLKDDHQTAALFRPSSMELVRSFGGDPLTFVSEMPLFITPAKLFEGEDRVWPHSLAKLQESADRDSLERRSSSLGIRPMPIGDQMRFQLELLDASMTAIETEDGSADSQQRDRR